MKAYFIVAMVFSESEQLERFRGTLEEAFGENFDGHEIWELEPMADMVKKDKSLLCRMDGKLELLDDSLAILKQDAETYRDAFLKEGERWQRAKKVAEQEEEQAKEE